MNVIGLNAYLCHRLQVNHPPYAASALVYELTRKGGAHIGGYTDNSAGAQMKGTLVNEIPPTPLYKRGALHGIPHRQAILFPLF